MVQLPLALHSNITVNIFYFAASCLNPGAPYKGNRIDQDFRHGRTVRFTCPRNYVMEGVTAIKCKDGQWNTNKPSCKGKGTLVAFSDLIRKKKTNIHIKTNQAHRKVFKVRHRRTQTCFKFKANLKQGALISTNLRPSQYLRYAHSYIAPTVAAMDSCFALIGAH